MERIIAEFTYSEFLDYVQNTPAVVGADGRIATESKNADDSEWYQTESYDEALNLAKHGWESGIKELIGEKDLVIPGITEVRHSVVGSVVDVGAFTSGSPESMLQFIDTEERDKEELVVYVGLSYNAGVGGDQAMRFTKTILRAVTTLGKDYSVKLVGVFAARHSGQTESIVFVTIKDTYQNLVLNNVAFSYHPSFFRRLSFRYDETMPFRDYGYGRPFENSEFIGCCEDYHKTRAKRIIIPSVQHIGSDWNLSDFEIK